LVKQLKLSPPWNDNRLAKVPKAIKPFRRSTMSMEMSGCDFLAVGVDAGKNSWEDLKR
jgi:hypothetical protein